MNTLPSESTYVGPFGLLHLAYSISLSVTLSTLAWISSPFFLKITSWACRPVNGAVIMNSISSLFIFRVFYG